MFAKTEQEKGADPEICKKTQQAVVYFHKGYQYTTSSICTKATTDGDFCFNGGACSANPVQMSSCSPHESCQGVHTNLVKVFTGSRFKVFT